MKTATSMIHVILSRSHLRGLLLVICVQLFLHTPARAAGTFDLTQSDDLLSLQADKASLLEIVDRLQEITDIPISFSEPFDNEISVNLQDVDIETLISSLVKNSLITKLDYQSHIKIAEIILIPEGSGGADNLANLPSGEPAEAVIVDSGQNTGQPGIDTAEPVVESTEQNVDSANVGVVNTSTNAQ